MKDTRQAYRGDNDVDVLALLHEECHLGVDEFLRHFLGISALTFTRLFEGDFEELCTKRLDLFASSRTGVEAADYSTHSPGLNRHHEQHIRVGLVAKAYRSNSTQASDASADNEDLAGRDLTEAL